MSHTKWILYGLLAACLALSACSKQEADTAAASAPKRTASLEIVSAEAKGFTVGALMAANPVYVFFDPQCPHCARLWGASTALQKKVKFVWIPVAFINASSAPQGAALLTAADPATRMAEHEKSILAGQGGLSAPSSVAPETEQAIKKNTRLFNNLGLESVPFVIARNARTGQTVSRAGAMETAALAELLGMDPP